MTLFNKKGKVEKWHLYLLSLDEKNFRHAIDERFSRITPLYILIYTQKRMRNVSEITDRNAKEELSKADQEWLQGCNWTICREHWDQNPNMLKEAMNKFILDNLDSLDLIRLEEELDKAMNEEAAQDGRKQK